MAPSTKSIKNFSRTTVRSGAARAAATGLLLTSLAGCSLIPSQVAPNPSPVQESSKVGTAIVGTGEKVDTATGSYEKITVNQSDPVYQYNKTFHDSAVGWTVEDAAAAQKFAVDYVAKEFLDSTALEGGDAEFKRWYAGSAGKYYSKTILSEVAQNPGESHVLLGNFGGKTLMPKLIHDGAPRIKEADLKVSGYSSWESNRKVLDFTIQFNAGYRVDDANAAELVGAYTNMTGAEVINSKYAKDNLKDGTGENVYRTTGSANVGVIKEPGSMKIISFSSKADFDTRDFSNQDAK